MNHTEVSFKKILGQEFDSQSVNKKVHFEKVSAECVSVYIHISTPPMTRLVLPLFVELMI